MEGRMYNLAAYRFGFNGKENVNEAIGMGRWQDYGARMYRPDLARFFSPDPIIEKEQKYAELSTYQFASNTPIMAIDLDGLEARIYIEGKGVGHVFISVQTEKGIVVYTYGRYLGGGKGKQSSSSLDPTGKGVMIRLEGREAERYIRDQIEKKNALVFEIKDVSKEKIIQYYEHIFKSGRKLTDEEEKIYNSHENKYGTSNDARVIDEYNLLKNNCTTFVVEGIKKGNSQESFEIDTNPLDDKKPVKVRTPLSMMLYLISQSKKKNSNVTSIKTK
jgi:RHS repeat-associated protein